MAKSSFSKKELRNAARIYAERRLAALDEVLDNEPVMLSPTFQQSIASIRQSAEEATIKRRRSRKRLAAICLIIILLITAFFSFNTTARAEFFNWLKSIYKEYIVYRFFGEKTSDALPELIVEWMPDDFQLTDTEILEDSRLYTFENTDGDAFVLECDKSHSGSAIYIFEGDDERQHLSIVIGAYEIDCYISEDDISDYIWYNTTGTLFFSMSSSLPHDTNVIIIENIKVVP